MQFAITLIACITAFEWIPVDAGCPKGCVCPSTSSIVECNTVKLEPFGMRVFSLKIVNRIEPLILKDQVFNVTGLENVNTISIENATIVEIEKTALVGIPLLSTLNIVNCNIPSLKDSHAFSRAVGLRTLKISDSTLKTFEKVKSEHLEELVLSGNKLEIISKDTFSELPSLTYINLSNNIISHIDPLAFSSLLYLQEVFLANNNITSLHSDLFSTNVELVTLDISNNPLKKFDINITADLEKLVLKSCQLEELNPNVTLSLDYLSYLDLSNNKINFAKTAFNKMSELDYIDLSSNNIMTLDPHIFRTNYKLQKIILDNNNFKTLPKFVCSGGNFETYLFSCNNCNISNLTIDSFKQFPALVTLNLANNHITSTQLSAFRHQRSLIELDLSYNDIANVNSDAFSKSSALEKISLAGNKINNIDPMVFENNKVLKTLDFSNCSLRQLWSQPVKSALSSLRQLILNNNNLSTITVSDLAVINSIEVLDVSNNPLVCDNTLKATITWLNEHEVSPIKFKTHEEMNTIDAVVFEGAINHASWKQLAKEKCPEKYYLENFETKHHEIEEVKKTTQASDDYDYHYGDFDSDEDSITSDESDESKQFGNDIVGQKLNEIISSKKKGSSHYSFLWPTLVFIFTALSVLVIAANIMLLMLRASSNSRNLHIPHIKIPQWNSGTKLKKHSGSVYQPLSEEKYDSCISITAKKEQVPTHIA